MRYIKLAAACLCFQFAAWAADTGPRAILLDGDGPWRDANWQLAAQEFRSLLRDAGYEVRVVAPPRLASELSPSAKILVAAPSLERLPASAFKAIAAHTARGGSLLATGGEPFREPMHATPAGEWITVRESLLRAPRKVIVEPASARLIRTTVPPQGVLSESKVSGPEGKLDSLELKIAKPVRVDPLQAEPFAESPFAGGRTTTIVTVRGTTEESLLVEWREADGARWLARVPLTPEWRTHALVPSDFTSPPTGGSAASARARFEPGLARVLSFGLASEVNTPVTAPVEYAIGPIAVGTAPEVEQFEPPVLETISPWYKQYDTQRDGRSVRVPVARQRGLTAAKETEGRYQTIGKITDPAASRFVTGTGADLFWLPWPRLAGADRAQLVELVRAANHRLALLNGGASEYVLLRGEPVSLGTRVLNASPQPASVEVIWTLRQGSRTVTERRAALKLPPGETGDLTAPDPQPLAPGEYQVETALRMGRTFCDRVVASLRVNDPQAPRTPFDRLRVENGHFTAGGKRVFLNGVNYWPRNVSGLEASRYWNHWLTPQNYDPDVVEADLAALQQLGFNLVSIQYNRTEQGRPLMDFLERCRRHGIWVHLSIGSANSLRLNPQRDTALVKAAMLSGNEAVFGYELAWEPHLGLQKARRSYDASWRAWVTEQYGSLPAAEQTWGVPAPRDEQGSLTNPLDQQFGTDGPHRIMVAAYRRFVDDLVSRTYGRAVRHLLSLDPGALFAVRTGWGGTGQRGNNVNLGYDLIAGAAHLDATSAEGYGMPATYNEARRTGFITAYGRWAGNGKPVLWLEFGASIGPRDGTGRTRRNQTVLCETMMRLAEDSGADGTAVWWYPGGWRYNERSDFGMMNPDGSPRDSALVMSKWGRKLNGAPSGPAGGNPITIEIDRDADARGLYGLWERFGGDYVKAREAGRPVSLISPGTGTDTGNMPMVQVGNAPYTGTGPLKYANAELAGIRVSWQGGEQVIENGGEVEVPADTEVQVTVSLVNTGEAAWVSTALRTNSGQTSIRERVPRYGTTTAGPLRVRVSRAAVELTGRVEATGHGSFGEALRLSLKPR